MFSFSLILCFFLKQDSASATEKSKSRDDYPFGEVETILVDYLKEKGSKLEVGTEEFNNFVMEQMDTDSDQELASREDYEFICAYFAEYLHRLSLEETQNPEQSLLYST